MKECKWSILTESGDIMLVARNCVTFSLPSSSCFVTLIDAFYYIEAHITRSTPSICAKACPTIREEVLAGITGACKKLRYVNDHPHLAVFCRHSGSTASSPQHTDQHAAVIDIENNCCKCTKGQEVAVLREEHTIWLTASIDRNEAASTSTTSGTLNLDTKPTLAKLSLLRAAQGKNIKIIKRVAPFWQRLGDQLDFDENGSKLATINADHSTSEACCRAMFRHWLSGNGVTPCLWGTLVDLLDNLDEVVLAQEIRSALSAT